MTGRRRRRRVDISITDRAFDRLAPDELQGLSKTHWTPIEVAVRATVLLCPTTGTRVLDVGAGVGKLCAVGALSQMGVWCGVEQHEALVDAARGLSRRLGVAERTMFLHGDAFSIDWRDFDAIYLFNPFETPLFSPIDAAQHLEYRRHVARVQRQLSSLADGVRVVTFHGFGGAMPPSFELHYHERFEPPGADLVLWIQRASARRAAEWS